MKTNQEILATFKRANQAAKLRMAQKAGFTTSEAYKAHLEGGSSSSTTTAATPKGPFKAKKATKPVAKDNSDNPELTDMVIAFDTTGSMRSYIDAVKNHVLDLIPKLFAQNPGLQLSIVAFGDYCDRQSSKVFGNAYQVIGLTNDQNALINFVNGAKNTSGGDTDEFYELVIKKVTEETDWRIGANKSVLLIADYNPHGVNYTVGGKPAGIDWKVEARKSADAGIIWDTLRILPQISWYQDLSNMTGGVCLPFSNSKKTSNLVEATSLARGGSVTKAAFMAKSLSKEVTEDAEMTSVYSMYKTVVDKK